MAYQFKGKSKRGKNPSSRRHLKAAYRSGLEDKVAAQIGAALGPEAVSYETTKVAFVQPAKNRTYTPDFVLPNGIVIETKGLFSADDRKKMVLIANQYPDLDIRFVFSNPRAKLYKGSPTTYEDWCVNNGFPCAAKLISQEWLTEPPEPRRIAAIAEAAPAPKPRKKKKAK